MYGGLGSGRLVILGGPGSGKSGAAILLLLDALKHRASIAKPEERAQVPVPVLFTAHGWDPSSERLIDWLAGRLVRNNDFLRAPEYGPNAAVRLIEGGYVAVILDGLDELPEALRPVALRALDTQATFRLVVLTRSEEMVATVSDGHLRAAAAIELLPVGPKQAAAYLASCQVQPLPQPWQDLVTHLRQDTGSAVAQALDNPLMLTLARDVYGPGDQVDELTDSGRFPSREAVEDHLLDQVLPAAYAHEPGQPVPPYTADQAQQWLGYLARCMNQDGRTRDLAWWQLPRWVPTWPRTLAIVVVLDLVFGLAAGLASAGELASVLAGLLIGLSRALMFGLGLALVSAPDKRPSPQWGPPSPDNMTRIRTALVAGFLIGLAFGFTSGFGDALYRGLREGLVVGTSVGLLVWLAVGFGFVLVLDRGAGFPPQLGRRWWWNRTALRATLAAGLAVGLISGLIVEIEDWLLIGRGTELAYGLVDGLIFGFGFGFAAELARRRSSQQLGKLQSDRPILIAAIIGFVIALSDPVLGFTFLLVVGLGGRPPRQLGRRRWTRANRRRTLVVGLVIGLVAGGLVGFQVKFQNGLWVGAAMGFAVGLVVGLVFTVLTWLGQPSTEAASPIDPRLLWGRERQFGLAVGLGVGLAVGLLYVLRSELPYGRSPGSWFVVGLKVGVVNFLEIGLGAWWVSSATWTAALAFAQLRRRGGTPMRLLRFLDDARDRQVLRTVGPMYQFRHARLQDRLADMCNVLPPVGAATGSRSGNHTRLAPLTHDFDHR
ncbi:MAG: hypothetical protein ACRDR6_07755 [Pseudonocardiaceae bacterium]